MQKPRLLIFTEWFPPAVRAGGPIRSTANLVGLLSSDLDIRVVTSDRDFGETKPYGTVPANEWITTDAGAKVYYTTPWKLNSRFVRQQIAEFQPQCIYLNSMFSARFTLLPAWLAYQGRYNGRVVVAPRGMLHRGALRFKSIKKRAFLLGFRISGAPRRLVFHATDEQEATDIAAHTAADPYSIFVVPNIPGPPTPSIARTSKNAGAVRLLFLSRLSPKKNLVGLLEYLKAIPHQVQCSLSIVGPAEDATYWARCRQMINDLPANIRVSVHDAVPHAQVRHLMAEHHALILPTMGENYGHAIYEAFGSGRPVIISDQTPWRGLRPSGVGWDLPLTDASPWIDAISTLASLEQQAFDELCLRAHRFANAHFQACDLKRKYIELFKGDINRRSEPNEC